MHGLIGGRWPSEQPDETHEKPKGQRAVPPGTPTNQRPTSPPVQGRLDHQGDGEYGIWIY